MKVLSIICMCAAIVCASPRDLVLAKKYFKDEVFAAAAEHYRKYLSDDPEVDEVPTARMGLARSLMKQFEYEKASQVYQDFLLSFPLHALTKFALYERAEVLTRLNQPGIASDLYYKFSGLDTTSTAPKALYKAAHYSYLANDFESAKGYAQQYLEKYVTGEERTPCIALLGRVAYKESLWSEAIKYLESALKSDLEEKYKAKAWQLIARSYTKVENVENAIAAYGNALLLADTTDRNALIEEYGKYLFVNEKYRDLIALLDDKALDELDESTQYRLLYSLVETKNFTVANATLNTLVFQDPEALIQTRFLTARILLEQGEPSEGIAVLNALGAEGYPEAYILAGDAYFDDAMYQSAIQSYYLAAGAGNSNQRKELMLKIAEIYETKLSRYKVAINVYEEFVQNYPSDVAAPRAALGVARCYLSEDKLKEASYEYRKVMEDYPSSIEAGDAERRFNYLNTFKLKNRDDALNHILLVMERGEYEEKLLHVARILEEDLKEHKRALKSYTRYASENPQGTKTDFALLKSGELYELLAMKLRYETQSSEIAENIVQARSTYRSIITSFPDSDYADDAQYHLLELDVFNLSAYQAFLTQYPQSNFAPDVLYAIGGTYLKQAEMFGGVIALKAVEYFQKILNTFKESELHEKALLGVSKAYYLTKEYKKARPTLTLLLKQDGLPKEVESEALYYDGLVYLKEKNYELAIKQFKKVQYRFFSTTSAERSQLMIARAYAEGEQPLEAKKAYEGFVQRFPYGDSIYTAYTGLMELYEKEQKWRKASEIFERFVTQLPKHPKKADALEKQGHLLQLAGEKGRAARAFLEAIASAPQRSKDHLYFNVAEMTLLEDDFINAAKYYSLALEVAQHSRDSIRALGGKISCLAMMGKHTEYTELYKQYKDADDSDDEGHARIFYYSGRAYIDAHEADKAKKRFEYLSEKFEETSWAGEGIYYLGIIAFKKGNFTEALNIFKGYLQDYPEGKSKSDVQFKMATCYYQQKNYLKAAELYTEVLQRPEVGEKTKYRAAYNAAIANEKSNQWVKAAHLYDILLKDYAELARSTSLYVSAGFCWYNAQEYEKAKAFFERALEDTESERKEEAHYWYARTLDLTGKVDEAVKEYYKVNYLYAASGMWALTALFDIGQIYERSGDIEKARKMYQKIVDRDGKSGSLGGRAYQYLQEMDARIPLKQGHGTR